MGIRRFPDACCGILFLGNHAYACNGHWLIKVYVGRPIYRAPDVQFIFYSYVTDEVYENYDPFFEVVGTPMTYLMGVLDDWRTYDLKVRIDDLYEVIGQNVAIVRERRNYGIHCGFDSDVKDLVIRLESKKGGNSFMRIPAYACTGTGFPEFSLNLSYFTKILDIISPFYDVIDLSFNGGLDDPVVIKAKNGQQSKPDMRFAIGQYIL